MWPKAPGERAGSPGEGGGGSETPGSAGLHQARMGAQGLAELLGPGLCPHWLGPLRSEPRCLGQA